MQEHPLLWVNLSSVYAVEALRTFASIKEERAKKIGLIYQKIGGKEQETDYSSNKKQVLNRSDWTVQTITVHSR